MRRTEPPAIRGVPMHPLADVGLPLVLTLQTALAVWLVVLGLRAAAGRPLLPGIGGWALLLAAESFLFTGYFFVREVDRPGRLRYVEGELCC